MKKVTVIFFLASFCVKGQDLHFSQFTEHPSLVNPALCGSESSRRASMSFKDQWGSVTVPYRSYGVTFESRFQSGNWKQVDNSRSMTFKKRTLSRVAAGGAVYNETSGDGKLGQTQVHLNLATFVPAGPESFIAAGLQGSFVQRRLDDSKLRFPDQFENSGFDPSVGSGENFSAYNFSYPDLGAGVLWYYGEKRHIVAVENILKARIGVGVFHLVTPQQKFLNVAPEMLFMKTVLHGDFIFGIRNTSNAFAPSFLVQFQGPSREIVFGGTLMRFFNDNSRYTGLVSRTYMGIGLHYRVKDALIATLKADIKQRYCLAMSYDINLSRLSASSRYRGGFEITLKYTMGAAYLYEEKKAPAQLNQK